MNILRAMSDPDVFGEAFRPSRDGADTWRAWRVFLTCLFGLPLDADAAELVKHHTGRSDLPNAGGFSEACIVCGRRGGKSRILSLIGLFLAVFVDHSDRLAPGEKAVVAVIAADRRQARNILAFTLGLLRSVPALEAMIVSETQDSVTLSNNVTVEVFSASFRLTRGTSLIAALMDEAAYMRDDVTSANPAAEIITALRPGLANLNGMLLIASSPYSRRGALWDSYRASWGIEGARVLCWKASTLEMNPALPAHIVEAAYLADPANAAEFGGEFRTDIASFVDRTVVEAAIVPDRFELPPLHGVTYTAFCDPSGGSADSYAIAIAHREGDVGVLDCIRERKPPFSPEAVTEEFADLLKQYRIHKVTGDRYAGEFPRELFSKRQITYVLSDRPKSDIMRDCLPLLNSRRLELLDNRVLTAQLISLERRTARSGRDSIDHAPGGHDDVAVSAMGALLAVTAKPSVGELWTRLAG